MENRVITIGRQFGSGGREIGQLLSESLGIPFYDRDLIELAVEKSGIDLETLEIGRASCRERVWLLV